MPKQRKQNSPEITVMYTTGAIVALGAAAAFYLNNGINFTREDMAKLMNSFFRENRSALITVSGTLSLGILTAWFGRFTITENNLEIQAERHKKSTYDDLNEHSERVNQSMSEGDYLAAANHCSQVQALLQELYSLDERDSLKQKISSFVYKQACVLYYKKDYMAAIRIITESLKNTSVPKDSREYVDLLTLRGLISFKQSLLASVTNENAISNAFLDDAERDFEEAYKINSDNAAYFYMRFIKKEYDYIVDYIPIEGFHPKHTFSLNGDNELKANLHLLFAEACFKKGEWAKAISLYEYHLESYSSIECNQLMELFAINLKCFRAYAELINAQKSPGDMITLKRLIKNDMQNSSEDSAAMHLMDFDANRDTVQGIAIEKFRAATYCLDCKLILTHNPSDGYMQHANLAYAYNLLSSDAQIFEINKYNLTDLPNLSNLSDSISKHQKIADEEKAKIVTPITSPEKTWYGYFFERSSTKGSTFIESILLESNKFR